MDILLVVSSLLASLLYVISLPAFIIFYFYFLDVFLAQTMVSIISVCKILLFVPFFVFVIFCKLSVIQLVALLMIGRIRSLRGSSGNFSVFLVHLAGIEFNAFSRIFRVSDSPLKISRPDCYILGGSR